MGAKISTCSESIGGHKFKKKEKGPKAVRHASVINLETAQIYDDVPGSNDQTQKQGQEEVPKNNSVELSEQLVEEFDEHLKTIKDEATLQKQHQSLSLANSTNTIYYDFSEDNESFHDVQSDNECEHQPTTTSSAQALPASSINIQDEPINVEYPKTIESSINFNQNRYQETVLENKSESSEVEHEHQKETHKYMANVTVHAVSDHSSASGNDQNNPETSLIQSIADSEINDAKFNNTVQKFDNSFDNVELSDVTEKNVEKDDSLKSITSADSVKELCTNNQISYEDPHKITENSVDHERSSESSSPRQSFDEHLSSFVIVPDLSKNGITSVDKLSTISSQSQNLEVKDQNINDERGEKHTPSKDTLNQENLIEKLSTSSSEADIDTDNSSFALSDAAQSTVNELKIIIESISVLEKDITAEVDSQNTYQALMKIMMKVNQIKNSDFDEQILNLQNKALRQINHCLKILKK